MPALSTNETLKGMGHLQALAAACLVDKVDHRPGFSLILGFLRDELEKIGYPMET